MSRFDRIRRVVTVVLAALAAFGFLWYANKEGARIRAEREAREAAEAGGSASIGVDSSTGGGPAAAGGALAGGTEASALLETGAGLMGKYEFAKAAELFAKAVELSNGAPDAKLNLAIATMNQSADGKQVEALTQLQKLLEERPEDLRVKYCIALNFLYLGDSAAALPLLKELATAVPGDTYCAFHLAQALESEDQPKEAAEWYAKAFALDGWLRSAVLGEQRCRFATGDEGEAQRLVALYDQLAADPRSHLAEFKYSRMGPLAELAMPGGRRDDAMASESEGPPRVATPFGAAIPIPADISVDLPWSGVVGIASTTAADMNNDGRLDLLVARAMQRGSRNAIFLGAADGRFQLDLSHPLAGIEGIKTALWGDVDNDGLVDCFLGREGADSLMMQQGDGTWVDIAVDAGVAGPVTMDDDLSERELEYPEEWLSSARLLVPHELELAGETIDGALADLDHDGDLDLLAIYRHARPRMFMNLGGGKFRQLGEGSGFVPARSQRVVNMGGGGASPVRVFEDAATGCTLADADGDNDVDVFIMRGARCEVWVNDLLWSWRRDPRHAMIEELSLQAMLPLPGPSLGTHRYAGLLRMPASTEVNPPMWLVAIEVTPTSARELWRKQASGAAQLCVADVDGGGAPEILVGGTRRPIEVIHAATGATVQEIVPDGMAARFAMIVRGLDGPELVVLSGMDCRPQLVQPGDRSEFLTVLFSGRSDPSQSMRSNSSGVGTRYAARAGGRWSQGTTFRNITGSGQSQQPVAIGIGEQSAADFITVEWSDGVNQTEIDLKPGSLLTVTETQRQLSSCPLIFVSSGEGFQFVTDCLGVGGVGYLADISESEGKLRAQYAPPRPWERVLLPLDVMQAKDGVFEVRLCEPMEEALYLDSARLVAYDLPQSQSLGLDERMGIADPQPTGSAFCYEGVLLPTGACLKGKSEVSQQACGVKGSDVTPQIRVADGAPVMPDADGRFIGRLTNPLSLELTFEEPLDAILQPVLLLDGWVEYPYGQTNFGMWQAGALPKALSLEARDPVDGKWSMILPNWGYPAGMTRQCSVRLPSLPPGCRELRLTTTQEIYLDRIAVAGAVDCAVIPQVLLPLSCHAAVAGYPRRVPQPGKRADFDYQVRAPLWDCRTQLGDYTNVGECTPLVLHTDDAVAIVGPGEELRLRFADSLPDPPAGIKRWWVLEVEGWCKDWDMFTLDGDRIEPLPAAEPVNSGSERESLHRRFNRRHMGGR